MKQLEMDGVVVYDDSPATSDLRSDVLDGLRRHPRRLPAKLFYDGRGSELFEEITQQPEYYPTRTELGILRDRRAEISAAIGPRARVVEFGSGSSLKIELLLSALEDPALYMPIEISIDALVDAVQSLKVSFPDLPVQPVCADYSKQLTLPEPPRDGDGPLEIGATVVFFPGSTIGNLTPPEAVEMLRRMGAISERRGEGLVLAGFDLHKDTSVLERAYNDSAGVTAEFNRNVLVRIRDELDAEIDIDGFEHRAVYDLANSRIEMLLESVRDQSVVIGDETFEFAAGERISTEYSHKFTPAAIRALGDEAGLEVVEMFTDADQMFAVVLFRTT